METNAIDEDSTDVSCYGHFKILPAELNDGSPTFLIANKFPYNIYNLVFSSADIQSAENYWISGQVWATVSGMEDCDLLTITQCTNCPSSIIVQNV